MFQLAPRYKVTSVWERRDSMPVPRDCVASGVIKMKMGVDDDGNIFGFDVSDFTQRLAERALTRYSVHRRLLIRPLFSNSRFHQYPFVTGINEHTVHIHGDPVVLVRRADIG